jgi:hypothetical protein
VVVSTSGSGVDSVPVSPSGFVVDSGSVVDSPSVSSGVVAFF